VATEDATTWGELRGSNYYTNIDGECTIECDAGDVRIGTTNGTIEVPTSY